MDTISSAVQFLVAGRGEIRHYISTLKVLSQWVLEVGKFSDHEYIQLFYCLHNKPEMYRNCGMVGLDPSPLENSALGASGAESYRLKLSSLKLCNNPCTELILGLRWQMPGVQVGTVITAYTHTP